MTVSVSELIKSNLEKVGATCEHLENFSLAQIDYFYDLIDTTNGWSYIVSEDDGSESLIQVNELDLVEGEPDAFGHYNIMARVGTEYYAVEDSRNEVLCKDGRAAAIILLKRNKIKRKDARDKHIGASYAPVTKEFNIPNYYFLRKCD